MSFAQDALIFGVAWTHVILAPFTKVEESFSLHAMHDIIMYGVSPEALEKYDHFVFSGAVPRSFVGNLFVGFIAKSALWLASLGDLLSSKLDVQIVLRLTLAALNAAAICLLRRSVERRFGRLTSLLFTALTCSQFHIPFWMGRTVPNMFALFPVNLAFWLLLRREKNALRASRSQVSAAMFLLTFAGVVLRAEVAGLLIPFALQCLYEGSISFLDLIKTGVISGVISLATTVAVDSYFWREWPMWPEFASLFFNVVEGKSAEWGVSPPQDYFTLHLPKLLLGALPLSILGFIADARVRTFILPALAFVCLISCIGHKEWRFIVYVVPLFNIAAARGARTLATRPKSSLFGRIVFLVGVGLIALNVPLTVLMTSASTRNYPGGDAMTVFNEMYANRSYVHVHISNLAAQTGASLFTQAHAPPYPEYLSFAQPESKNWVYNKTEGLTRTELLSGPFTHLIAEEPLEDARWAISRSVSAFAGWSVDRDVAGLVRRDGLMGVFGVLQMRREEMLWIIERRS